MNLYLVTQSKNTEYDTYDSFVVAAPNARVARHTYPNPKNKWVKGAWASDYSAWVLPKYLKVKKIGTTNLKKVRVILFSFNAG